MWNKRRTRRTSRQRRLVDDILGGVADCSSGEACVSDTFASGILRACHVCHARSVASMQQDSVLLVAAS